MSDCFKPAPCTATSKCYLHAKCVCGDVGYYYQFPAGYFSSPEAELPHTDDEWEKFKVPCKDCG